MRITKLHITNFKRFRDRATINFTPGLNILVGDNEVGKSTILEAIHLVLTGYLNGRLLRSELSQSLFNNEAVAAYIESLAPGKSLLPLPEILIEVHLAGEGLALLEGDGNETKTNKVPGLMLRIAFAEKYQAEYEALLKAPASIKSIPIEFYEITWRSFARKEVTARTIPIKSALIDSSAARYANGSDLYVSRIVRDLLDTDDVVRLTQAHRAMRDAFVGEDAVIAVNEKIQKCAAMTTKKVHLSAESSSASSWESVLVTFVDDVPFQQIGRGEQSVVKTRLALGHKKSKEANILLIEEPENHLSHSKLNELVSAIQADGGLRQIIISTHSSFVANKLGLQSLVLLTRSNSMRLGELSIETQRYFQRLPGFDTLRLILCRRAILVEGPSDELVVQKAYQCSHGGHLPIQDGVEVISVGTSFLRFLEVAKRLNVHVNVVTDNDGNVDAVRKKYAGYLGLETKGIRICFDEVADDVMTTSEGKQINTNTLEPKLLKSNGRSMLNNVLGTNYESDVELLVHMSVNKTECALSVFDTEEKLTFPGYIDVAVA